MVLTYSNRFRQKSEIGQYRVWVGWCYTGTIVSIIQIFKKKNQRISSNILEI